MTKIGLLCLMGFLTCYVCSLSQAQTYTYLPGNTGCDQTWMNGDCWQKDNINGCDNSSSEYPPLIDSGNLPSNKNDIKDNCEVHVYLNDDITLNPGYDFAFYSPEYNIHLGEEVSLSITGSVYFNPGAALNFIHSNPGGVNAEVFINGDIDYNKQSTLTIQDGIELEVNNVKNAFGSQYEGNTMTVSPLAAFRVRGSFNFTQGNTNVLIVEGLLEVNQLNLDAGNEGDRDNDIPNKNQLIIRGSGSSNICSGIHAQGDSYILVEEDGVLNLPSLSLAGQAMFDNKATANLQDISLAADAYFRMFEGSHIYNETYSNSSAQVKIIKCGTEVSHPSDGVTGCGAQYTEENSAAFWEDYTGDWCFRILPIDRFYEGLAYEKENNLVRVEWVTAKEWENSHFEIERALDKTLRFEKIGKVEGVGWADELTAYIFEDNAIPMKGNRIYYRIKQVDFNGTYSYGKVLSVQTPEVRKLKGIWRVYPNPVKEDILHISLLDPSQVGESPVTFRLIHSSSAGQWRYSIDSIPESGEVWLRNLPDISRGVAILEIQWGDKIDRIKLMKF